MGNKCCSKNLDEDSFDTQWRQNTNQDQVFESQKLNSRFKQFKRYQGSSSDHYEIVFEKSDESQQVIDNDAAAAPSASDNDTQMSMKTNLLQIRVPNRMSETAIQSDLSKKTTTYLIVQRDKISEHDHSNSHSLIMSLKSQNDKNLRGQSPISQMISRDKQTGQLTEKDTILKVPINLEINQENTSDVMSFENQVMPVIEDTLLKILQHSDCQNDIIENGIYREKDHHNLQHEQNYIAEQNLGSNVNENTDKFTNASNQTLILRQSQQKTNHILDRDSKQTFIDNQNDDKVKLSSLISDQNTNLDVNTSQQISPSYISDSRSMSFEGNKCNTIQIQQIDQSTEVPMTQDDQRQNDASTVQSYRHNNQQIPINKVTDLSIQTQQCITIGKAEKAFTNQHQGSDRSFETNQFFDTKEDQKQFTREQQSIQSLGTNLCKESLEVPAIDIKDSTCSLATNHPVVTQEVVPIMNKESAQSVVTNSHFQTNEIVTVSNKVSARSFATNFNAETKEIVPVFTDGSALSFATNQHFETKQIVPDVNKGSAQSFATNLNAGTKENIPVFTYGSVQSLATNSHFETKEIVPVFNKGSAQSFATNNNDEIKEIIPIMNKSSEISLATNQQGLTNIIQAQDKKDSLFSIATGKEQQTQQVVQTVQKQNSIISMDTNLCIETKGVQSQSKKDSNISISTNIFKKQNEVQENQKSFSDYSIETKNEDKYDELIKIRLIINKQSNQSINVQKTSNMTLMDPEVFDVIIVKKLPSDHGTTQQQSSHCDFDQNISEYNQSNRPNSHDGKTSYKIKKTKKKNDLDIKYREDNFSSSSSSQYNKKYHRYNNTPSPHQSNGSTVSRRQNDLIRDNNNSSLASDQNMSNSFQMGSIRQEIDEQNNTSEESIYNNSNSIQMGSFRLDIEEQNPSQINSINDSNSEQMNSFRLDINDKNLSERSKMNDSNSIQMDSFQRDIEDKEPNLDRHSKSLTDSIIIDNGKNSEKQKSNNSSNTESEKDQINQLSSNSEINKSNVNSLSEKQQFDKSLQNSPEKVGQASSVNTSIEDQKVGVDNQYQYEVQNKINAVKNAEDHLMSNAEYIIQTEHERVINHNHETQIVFEDSVGTESMNENSSDQSAQKNVLHVPLDILQRAYSLQADKMTNIDSEKFVQNNKLIEHIFDGTTKYETEAFNQVLKEAIINKESEDKSKESDSILVNKYKTGDKLLSYKPIYTKNQYFDNVSNKSALEIDTQRIDDNQKHQVVNIINYTQELDVATSKLLETCDTKLLNKDLCLEKCNSEIVPADQISVNSLSFAMSETDQVQGCIQVLANKDDCGPTTTSYQMILKDNLAQVYAEYASKDLSIQTPWKKEDENVMIKSIQQDTNMFYMTEKEDKFSKQINKDLLDFYSNSESLQEECDLEIQCLYEDNQPILESERELPIACKIEHQSPSILEVDCITSVEKFSDLDQDDKQIKLDFESSNGSSSINYCSNSVREP